MSAVASARRFRFQDLESSKSRERPNVRVAIPQAARKSRSPLPGSSLNSPAKAVKELLNGWRRLQGATHRHSHADELPNEAVRRHHSERSWQSGCRKNAVGGHRGRHARGTLRIIMPVRATVPRPWATSRRRRHKPVICGSLPRSPPEMEFLVARAIRSGPGRPSRVRAFRQTGQDAPHMRHTSGTR